jgi:hypothetical protein
MKMIAIVLILIGVLAIGYQGFSYVTRDEVVDLGLIEVTKEKTNTVYLPPVIGAIILVAGVALFLTNSRRA